MDLALPEDVQQCLQGFEELLSSLECTLKPFTDGADSMSQLEPVERAQAHLALARAVHCLLRLYLQSRGVDPADHDTAKKEQERLRQYERKVRKAAADKELRESKRSLEVNVAAVNRFITAAVPDLNREQKAALKQAGQRHGSAGAAAATAGGGKRAACGGAGDAAAAEAADAAAAFLQEAMAELGQQGGTTAGAGAVPGSSKKRRQT